MLKNISGLASGSSLLALMFLPTLAIAHGHDYLFNSGSQYVQLEPNRVISKGNTVKRAIIRKRGALQIGSQAVAVSARGQKYLANYYDIVFATYARIVRAHLSAVLKPIFSQCANNSFKRMRIPRAA